jgi:uncharacterized protein YebE (UPF0316 family)
MAPQVIDSLQAVPAFVVPVLIFFARIVDVSLGTLRLVVLARGLRGYASLLGFLEVFIWLLAISQVLANLHGIVSYLAYSAGFAAGTFVGMTIERRLLIGMAIVRVVVPQQADDLVGQLRNAGYSVTRIRGSGSKGPVEVIFSVLHRRELKRALDIVHDLTPHAFYSVEDVRTASGTLPRRAAWLGLHRFLQPFYWFRKSK